MAVSSTTNKVIFTGDGIVTAFPFTFRVFLDTDIVATLYLIADGTETVQTITTHYTVTVNGVSGGTVDMVTAPAATYKLIIQRVLPLTQTTDYVANDPFPAETHEEGLDRGIMVSQQIDADSDLAIKVDNTQTGLDLTLPQPESGKIIGYNTAADGFQNYDEPSASATAAAASAAAALISENAASADLALTNADVTSTNADVVSTNADVVSTNADVVLTNADVVSTNADVVTSAASEAAAALSAAKLSGTSTTSLLIATGTKIFTTQAGKFFDAGNFILITSDADPLNYMSGQVTTYSSTTLTMNILEIGGSGTLADWTIRVSGRNGTDGADGDVTLASAQTLTNKRITQRVVTTTSDATAVIDVDVTDVYELSAVAVATVFTLTGTPTDGQKIIVRFKDNATSYALTWTGFTAIGVTLPVATTISKWHYVGIIYNSAASQWQAIAVSEEA